MGYAISFSEYCSEYRSLSWNTTTMYKSKKIAQKNFDEIKQKLVDCPNKDISEVNFPDDKTIKYKRQIEFLNFVETDGCFFCVAFGGLNRAIEIQCQPRQVFALKGFDNKTTGQAPDIFNAPGFHLRKGS